MLTEMEWSHASPELFNKIFDLVIFAGLAHLPD